MADLATQNATGGSGQITFTAAAAGGDTIQAGSGGGGWDLPVVLLLNHATTGTKTVTVAGHAPVTVQANSIAAIPVRSTYRGRRLGITYSAVTSLTVAAVEFAPGLVP
jgi:hypothetical protein